jgi:excinuclease ABC subunit A
MTHPDSSAAAIRLRGVRHNNLKNFDLDLPVGRLTVITGLSGSGKSSLAFDTLFAEGQRRYIETFSAYARQFFDRMDKPQVDRIEGIPPAIAIEQRNAVRSTRSTVGTMTELCDYLKLLWPHLAQLHCRQCGQPVRRESPQIVWETIAGDGGINNECLITFDLPLSEKLSLKDSFALISKQGYQRLLIKDSVIRLEDAAPRLGPRPSRLTIIQDRMKLTSAHRARFVEACEQAYHFGRGRLALRFVEQSSRSAGEMQLSTRHFSSGFHCAACDLDYREPTPALFSFNHPIGACATCKGFGRIISIDYNRAIPDRSKTLAQGAIKPWQSGQSAECQADLAKFCKTRSVPMSVPFAELSQDHQRWVLEGDPGYGTDEEHQWPNAWYGVKGYFRWLESKAYKMHVRVLLSRYRAYTPCPDCQGKRLKPEALLYRLPLPEHGLTPDDSNRTASAIPSPAVPRQSSVTLADFYALPVQQALGVIERLIRDYAAKLNDPLALVLNEIHARLRYLVEVGLGYLTLDRPTRTLSGGETERVNLTTCLGTRLVNTLFVLDEPSVGLHARDTARLIEILERLRDTGNTVVVVEHEPSVMRAADQIVDLGPGRGEKGGDVVFCGAANDLLRSEVSLTGQYLSGRKQVQVPQRRPVPAKTVSSQVASDGNTCFSASALTLNEAPLPFAVSESDSPALKIFNASCHNLKNLSLEIPLGRFVCLTGVSGSGKTTLIREVLLPALQAKLGESTTTIKASDRLDSNETTTDETSFPEPGLFQIAGSELLSRVVLVDQTPLGKTPRSNPVVYIGAFEDIRDLFAQTDLAKQRGLNSSAFSFNSAIGQCERCRGAGFEKIEMQFLSDVFIRCPECNGRRYREHILEVKLRGETTKKVFSDRSSVFGSKAGRQANGSSSAELPNTEGWSIADLLEATVDKALEFLIGLVHLPAARRAIGRLKLLQEVGLGYLRLGQPINSLSGGESQRLKLVSHLADSAATCEPESADVKRFISKNNLQAVKQWLAQHRGKRRAGSAGVEADPSRAETEPERRVSLPLPGGEDWAEDEDRALNRKGTLFLFDEPTTGLHFDDVRMLLQVFQRLVNAGHSVLVIEHNLEVIKCADWVIDLGPEAGEGGGQLVACGTPEDIAGCEASHTGQFLRQVLGSNGVQTMKPAMPERKAERLVSRLPTFRVAAPERSVVPLSSKSAIAVHGAREHNLKNLSVEIPRGKFVVITGVSGSGKSTLAFDLLFAEGQRRFLDSMNTYARQFVEQLARPDVDLISGLPPTVSIEQRNTRGGGKSTVATVTEVYHFLRLLFARLGQQFCPDCQLPVEAQTRDALAAGLRTELKKRGDLLLLAPVVRNRKGFHSDVGEWAARHGYQEVRADGKIYETSKPFRLDRFKEHDVEIVVGVLEKKSRAVSRTHRETREPASSSTQRIEQALDVGRGTLFALDNHGRLTIHSTERACPKCARSFAPLDPKNFSYNSSQGWCPTCRGFGQLFYIPDADRGANADAIEESWWSWAGEREICPDCHGARLRSEARAVRLRLAPLISRGKAAPTITEFSALSVSAAYNLFRRLKLKGREALIARDILPEIAERLKFLDEVGLGYLQLGRSVTTLSGGEAQRIRLAAQLGSNLSGVLYVLDEPTIGLHARDNQQLLAALDQLQSRGNSLVVVEHDEETMRRADYVIDLGPGAGVHGGEVVAAGTLRELIENKDSITGQCLRTKKCFPSRGQRRAVFGKFEGSVVKRGARESGRRSSKSDSTGRLVVDANGCGWLTLHDANAHNLKNLTVRFPLNRFVVVTGVSGSGKSTLIRECLLPALEIALRSGRKENRRARGRSDASRGAYVTGYESLKAVYEVDQSPIGRTPRSTPATYVGFFDEIRALFAQTPEARMRGYTASRFSFNSAQGRCPECQGAGTIKLEMNFLPPAFVRCESCGGSRFNRETLDVQYAGRNVAEVLDLSVEEALEFFRSVPRIVRPLEALRDTGLHYLKLGQTSPTLSGGEAQRVKLVTHLLTGLKEQLELFDPTDQKQKRNLFVLEEPTIGLHMSDVHRLVEVLQRLVDAGHSVIVIEHNLDLIAEADWIIDLGPEGGEAGGSIVGEATPEGLSRRKTSHTGRFLRQHLHSKMRP